MSDYARTLPADVPAERAVLGSLLQEPDALSQIADTLRGAAFVLERHGQIFEAALAVYARREPVDVTTVAGELRRRDQLDVAGGMTALVELTGAVSDPYRISTYAAAVQAAYRRRLLIETGGAISAHGYDESRPLAETLDAAETALLAVTRHAEGVGFVGISAAVQQRAAQYQAVLDGEVPPGVATGLPDLDRIIGGLKPGQLICVGARPGVGKSALLQTLARNIARAQGHAGIISLEMSRDELIDRFCAMETGLDLADIANYRLRNDGPARLYAAYGTIEQWPISIDDEPGQSVSVIRARARALHRRAPLDCLFVDYVQLVGWAPYERNENDAITTISKGLKALARELAIPIVALAQLNREVEKRASHVPTLADFRGSGSLEQDADVVIFPYREELYEPTSANRGLAELHVAKQRNGPRGMAPVRFDGPTAQFCALERYREVPGYGLHSRTAAD